MGYDNKWLRKQIGHFYIWEVECGCGGEMYKVGSLTNHYVFTCRKCGAMAILHKDRFSIPDWLKEEEQG